MQTQFNSRSTKTAIPNQPLIAAEFDTAILRVEHLSAAIRLSAALAAVPGEKTQRRRAACLDLVDRLVEAAEIVRDDSDFLHRLPSPAATISASLDGTLKAVDALTAVMRHYHTAAHDGHQAFVCHLIGEYLASIARDLAGDVNGFFEDKANG